MKQYLVILDDIWHPADVIERGFGYLQPSVGDPATADGMALAEMPAATSPAGDQEYSFEFVRTAKDILTPDMLADYPIIFCCNGNTINAANTAPWFEAGVTEVGPAELRAYVEAGGTYVAIHAGSDVNAAWVPQEPKFVDPCLEYIDLVGCSFVDHPPRCLVSHHVVMPDHPIMEGVQDFSERDEQYHMNFYRSDMTKLLTSTTEAGGEVLAGYTFSLGKGHVIVLTPGHTLAVWKNENFQRMIKNIIRNYG